MAERGRPTKYTAALASEIIERLSNGEPLAKICRDEHMPATRTISDWKAAHESFSADFARAREEGFDAIALETLEIADFGERDVIETEDGREIVNHDVIQRSRLRVETRLKLLAKWDPKRYGDKVQHADSDGNNLPAPQWIVQPVAPAPQAGGDA